MVNRSNGAGTKIRVNECVVGDNSGIVVFTAKNDQGMYNIFILGLTNRFAQAV